MRRHIPIAICLLGLLVMAPPVSAKACPSDGGVAAIDQYCPVLPSADGQDPRVSAAHGERLEMGVSPTLVARLRSAGRLGETLLALPLAAPKARIPGEGRPHPKDVAALEQLLRSGPFDVSEGATTAEDAFAGIVRAVADENAISDVLRWGLVASAFGLFGLAGAGAQRRHRTHP